MSSTTPAILAAAAGVGFGHAVLPDHWVPLAVLGRTRRYRLSRVARLASLAGVAHVLVSIALGAIIVVVGLQFRSAIQSAQDTIIGCVLILTGIGFGVLEMTGHGHHHEHEDAHDHEHPHLLSAAEADERVGSTEGTLHGLAVVMVPFGAAASPDLTILPVFLTAAAAGTATAISSLLIFAAVTIGTIVTLTLAACFSGYQIQGEWLERWGNVFTAMVLITIGALVLGGVI